MIWSLKMIDSNVFGSHPLLLNSLLDLHLALGNLGGVFLSLQNFTIQMLDNV